CGARPLLRGVACGTLYDSIAPVLRVGPKRRLPDPDQGGAFASLDRNDRIRRSPDQSRKSRRRFRRALTLFPRSTMHEQSRSLSLSLSRSRSRSRSLSRSPSTSGPRPGSRSRSRSLLAGAAALVVSALALAGCASDGEEARSGADSGGGEGNFPVS